MPWVPTTDPSPDPRATASGRKGAWVPVGKGSVGIGDIPGAVAETAAGLLARQAENAVGVLKRNAAPIALQGAGQTAGELGGALLAPDTGGASLLLPLLLGAAGAGAGNVVASKLPKEYGGTPGESKLKSFLWGAIPAVVGGAATKVVGRGLSNAATKAGTEAADAFETAAKDRAKDQVASLAEAIKGEPVTQGHVNRLARLLGGQIGGEPAEGAERTAATNDATGAILGPINRMRTEVGAPLGKAYEKLKGTDQRITPDEASELADAARGVRDDLISPAPKAAAMFRKLQSFAPRVGEDANAAKLVTGPNGQLLVSPQDAMRGLNTAQVDFLQKAEQAKGSPLTFRETQAAIQSMPTSTYEPPTLDELRESRQQIDGLLRGAKGGDVHGLLGLRSQLDKVLSDRLPDNMGDLRKGYAGFIKNYQYRDLNKLRAAGSPSQAAQWLFSRDPSVVNEIIGKATPEERGTIRNMFGDHVLKDIDPDAPVEEQTAMIRRNLRGPSANGTLKRLYGPEVQEAKDNLIHLPARRAALAKNLQSTSGQKLYVDGATQEARKLGSSGQQAALAGFNKWAASLPPEDQEFLAQIVQPASEGAPLTLPSPAETLAAHLRANPARGYMPKFALANALGSAGALGAGVAMGGNGYMLRVALGFGILSGSAAGYNAAMRLGGADLIGKMYAKPAGKMAGAMALRTLALIGGRIAHQETQPTNNTVATMGAK